MKPIGVCRTPFTDKKDAPRQGTVLEAKGTIELEATAEMRDALSDLGTWTHVWIIYLFDKASGWKPKVQPPRSAVTRGVFATRSPHRPNPIGLTAVKLDKIEGCTLHVTGVDMIDGTPVLDIKPYVPYADSIGEAGEGWLRHDPAPPWSVEWSDEARERIAWLADRGIDLKSRVEQALALGPEPHAYRRIKNEVLAVKDWRARFSVRENRVLRVIGIHSGWRLDQAEGAHRDFILRFGESVSR